MISLSLCMIVKNEEKNLENCLNSVKNIVDEIIIVDTGSIDKTKSIARKYTDKVYDFVWCDDFSKARNYSISKATKDYIIWLDADDIVLEKDCKKILDLKENLSTDINYIMMKYQLNLDENGIPALEYYRERIFKNNRKFKFVSPIHETVNVSGNFLRENICIVHTKKPSNKVSDRNLLIFEKMKKENYKFSPRDIFYFARELYYNKRYKEAIKYFNEFIDSKDGWIENKISACIDLSNIYLELNDIENYFSSLLKSFKFDKPRAEICCKIGSYFLLNKDYIISSYWYTKALEDNYDIENGGFYIKDYYDFIPYINLCVCYYNLGDISKSKLYNELAGKIKPNNNIYLSNRILLEKL